MRELSPGDITAMLGRWQLGDSDSLQKLIPLVYAELRVIARAYMSQENPGHTLGATGLVHETFLRMAGDSPQSWKDRRHFYGVAARLMRQVLVDHARRRAAEKRQRPDFPREASAEAAPDYLSLDHSLSALEKAYPRRAQIVEFRYFGGLTLEEIAGAVDLSITMVAKELKLAQLWLYKHMEGAPQL